MNKNLTLISLFVSVALAACGGGGSDPITTTAPVLAPLPVAAPSTSSIVLSAPPAAYLGGTEELAAFNLLNAERGRCGFGQVKQDTRLDSVARGHADWLLVNNYSGHFQVAGTPGFTGVSPADRAQTAGYPAMTITDENAGSTGGVGSIAGRGAHAVRSLLAAPYHLAGLVSGAREIGIAIRNDTLAGSTNGPRTVEQFNLSVPVGSSAQLPASDAVLTYPCEGTTGTAYRLAGESPNPIPGRDLSVSPIGHPVYVYARPSSTVVVTSASMIAASTGLPVTLRAPVSQVNDPAGIYSGNQVMVMPDAALSQSTSYQVNLAGTINGAPFTRTFTFLTGTTSAGG